MRMTGLLMEATGDQRDRIKRRVGELHGDEYVQLDQLAERIDDGVVVDR